VPAILGATDNRQGGDVVPEWLSTYSAPVLTWLGAVLTVYVTHQWTLSRELTKVRLDEQLRTYRELMGMRVVLRQLSSSHLELAIQGEYYARLWELRGSPDTAFQLDEYRTWVRQDVEVQGQLTKAIQRLYELLATANVLFPADAELSRRIEALYEDPGLVVRHHPNPDAGPVELAMWRDDALAAAREDAASAYTGKLDALLVQLGPMTRHQPWSRVRRLLPRLTRSGPR
jgi:hypothetical protein